MAQQRAKNGKKVFKMRKKVKKDAKNAIKWKKKPKRGTKIGKTY